MSIRELMDGDYEGAVVGAGKHLTTGATQAGETAMKAIHARLKAEGPQKHADTHGPVDGQNYGAEKERRKGQRRVPREPEQGSGR
jgi:hypothetical protein